MLLYTIPRPRFFWIRSYDSLDEFHFDSYLQAVNSHIRVDAIFFTGKANQIQYILIHTKVSISVSLHLRFNR